MSGPGRDDELDGLMANYARRRVAGDSEAIADALTRIGSALIRRGRLGEAARALHSAHTHRLDAPEAAYLLGMVERNRGRPVEAAPFFERAAALRPNWSKPHLELGRGRYA